MTSYAQVGVSVRSWHVGDPVDEAVALDPSICQGRYLGRVATRYGVKVKRSESGWPRRETGPLTIARGEALRVASPWSLLTSGPPSPGDATFLTPVLVCPVPEGRVEYLSQACAAKPMDAAEGRGALRALRRGPRRPRCRRLPRAKLHLGLARRKDVDALDLGVDAVGDDRGTVRVRGHLLEVPAPEVGVAHDADVAERALGRSVGRPRVAEVPEAVALVGAE